MIEFNAMILQFAAQGEKTGWSYISVPAHLAQEIKPGNKKSFRVKGLLDGFPVAGIALMAMGKGDFIMPLKAAVRKGIHKNAGAMVLVSIEEDKDFKVEIPDDLKECFDFEPEALDFFNSLPKSHRDYFIKWIDSAKTSETRANRIVNTINAMLHKWGYGEMMKRLARERS